MLRLWPDEVPGTSFTGPRIERGRRAVIETLGKASRGATSWPKGRARNRVLHMGGPP